MDENEKTNNVIKYEEYRESHLPEKTKTLGNIHI